MPELQAYGETDRTSRHLQALFTNLGSQACKGLTYAAKARISTSTPLVAAFDASSRSSFEVAESM